MPAPVQDDLADKPRYMRLLRERHGSERLSPADWAEIKATHYGMVSRVDDPLGRLVRAVERSGAAARTLTIFTTDHGEYLGDYGLIEKWPSGQHECLLRNPLLVTGPGVREGNVATAFVELVDLLPTLLERAEFPYDLKSALQHEDPECVGRVVSVRTETHTDVHRLYEAPELYDRARDPGERVNLAGRAELAAVETGLRERVLDWLLESADVIPWEPDARFDNDGAL
jgi:arylsulfatase A-like enzyme